MTQEKTLILKEQCREVTFLQLQMHLQRYTVLMKYLEKGAKNAKMVPWQIQNDIIECLSEFVRLKIKDGIPEYSTSIVDDVTDRFSNKEILLLYYFTSLRYVKCCTNEKS